jgi:hypothetical protein
VGGIVGRNYGIVMDSMNSASIRGNGDIGGIVGGNASTARIKYVDNFGTISFWLQNNNVRSIGGVAGYNNAGFVFVSSNSGNFVGENAFTAEVRMGGVIGHHFGSFNPEVYNLGRWNVTYTWGNGFLGIGAFNNGRYLFKSFDGRVGRVGW